MEGCKLRFAETDKPEWGLVTRDYALAFFFCIPKASKETKGAKTNICFSGFRKNTKKTKRAKNKIFGNLVILVVFGIKYILGINIIFGMNYFLYSERICVT